MNIFIRFFIRLLPTEVIEELNDFTHDELHERGLIIYPEDIETGAVICAEDLDKNIN